MSFDKQGKETPGSSGTSDESNEETTSGSERLRTAESDNAHSQGILAQLRVAEADDELPADVRERAQDRADELEAELDDAPPSEWSSADDHGVVSEDVQEVRPDGGQELFLYLLELCCDACRRISKVVVEYDQPVAVDRDLSHEYEHCPYCGDLARWHVLEETRVERVPPVDELDRGEGVATDGGQVKVCPNCDSTEIHRRNGGSMHSPCDASAAAYRCRDCSSTFDTPVTRERRGNGSISSPHGRSLLDADAHDIATDGGVEPFTEDLELAPHPWELGRAINSDHVVRLSFHDDRDTNVTLCVWGTPTDAEWPHEVDDDLNWTTLDIPADTATALAERAGDIKHELSIDGARVFVSAHVGRSKHSEPARDAPLLDEDTGQAVAADGGRTER